MNAEDLVQLIRQRYPLHTPGEDYQSHVVLEQVPDGTGYHVHWIDAVVFSLWESKGLSRFAFEVKISRSDFIRELRNPLKHQWVMECFHELWFVAPQDVIQLEELPPNIGWLCPRGDKLIIKRHAVRNPKPRLDDIVLAAFMRAASKEIDKVSRVMTKSVLESSKEYQLAKLHKDAVITFINEKGLIKYVDPSSAEELLQWLNDATMDNQLKQDREHLLHIAGRFQREIISLLNLFLIIANKSLLARDELGKHIVSEFGGDDKENVETLKEFVKNSRLPESQKPYAELVERVLNWDQEFSRS